MPLKIKLKPNERLVVNGAVLINGQCKNSITVLNFAHILRQSDVMQESEADTPTKKAYYIVQLMLMHPPPDEDLMRAFKAQIAKLKGAFLKKESVSLLNESESHVESGDYYRALAGLRKLITYEAVLLNLGATRSGISGETADRELAMNHDTREEPGRIAQNSAHDRR